MTAAVRRELRTLLPLAGDLEVVGEAADGAEAIRLVEALRPQVILLDLQMPVLDGYAAARRIKAAGRRVGWLLSPCTMMKPHGRKPARPAWMSSS